MYDRAPRNMTVPTGSTAEQVGPGTYDGNKTSPAKIKADGYAPFLSMTNRESVLNPTDQVIAAPGPGHYDPRFAQDMILGGKTMKNKSKRFQDVGSDTPGPGSYTLSKRRDWIKETGKVLSHSAPATSSGDKSGSLMTSRIKFHRKPEAPSIPAPGQAYGYEENDDGTLRKQDPPEKDNTMGPAYYNAYVNDTKPTKHYKGIHFGKLTSKRMDFGGKEGPGPGEYEPYRAAQGENSLAKVEHSNLREADQQRFEAKLPRYHEAVVMQEEKKAVPGPGKYEVRGQFEPQPGKTNPEGIEIEHPPFGSQAKRFHPNKNINPAPGSYNDPRSALEGMKKITGLKRSPFGQTSVRFNQEHHIRKTPGPGAYNRPGLGSESMKKAYIESTRRGAFGTTSVRIQPITKRLESELPGPAHYQVKEKLNQPRYQQLSSTFASLSSRLTEAPSVVRDLPPPGSYEVSKAYLKTQGKINPGEPRSDAARQKQGAFRSSSSRFAPPRDIILEETDPANPGPGAYLVSGKLTKKGGLMVTKDTRFREVVSEVPGPGNYEFSPLIQDTVLKGTFNATLNNPIAPKMDALDDSMMGKQAFLLGV